MKIKIHEVITRNEIILESSIEWLRKFWRDLPEKLSPTLKFIVVYKKVVKLIGFTLRDRFSQSVIIEIY